MILPLLCINSNIIKLVMLTTSYSSHLESPLLSFVFSHPWHSLSFSTWFTVSEYLYSHCNLCFCQWKIDAGIQVFLCTTYFKIMLEMLVVWPRFIPPAFSYASLHLCRNNPNIFGHLWSVNIFTQKVWSIF